MGVQDLRSKVFTTAWKNYKNGNRFAKTFAKALKSAWKFWLEKYEDSKAVKFDKIIRETVKAIYVQITRGSASSANDYNDVVFNSWIPKSVLEDGKLPSWIWLQKCQEDSEMRGY